MNFSSTGQPVSNNERIKTAINTFTEQRIAPRGWMRLTGPMRRHRLIERDHRASVPHAHRIGPKRRVHPAITLVLMFPSELPFQPVDNALAGLEWKLRGEH